MGRSRHRAGRGHRARGRRRIRADRRRRGGGRRARRCRHRGEARHRDAGRDRASLLERCRHRGELLEPAVHGGLVVPDSPPGAPRVSRTRPPATSGHHDGASLGPCIPRRQHRRDNSFAELRDVVHRAAAAPARRDRSLLSAHERHPHHGPATQRDLGGRADRCRSLGAQRVPAAQRDLLQRLLRLRPGHAEQRRIHGLGARILRDRHAAAPRRPDWRGEPLRADPPVRPPARSLLRSNGTPGRAARRRCRLCTRHHVRDRAHVLTRSRSRVRGACGRDVAAPADPNPPPARARRRRRPRLRHRPFVPRAHLDPRGDPGHYVQRERRNRRHVGHEPGSPRTSLPS